MALVVNRSEGDSNSNSNNNDNVKQQQDSSANMILIKYANVTSTSSAAKDSSAEQQSSSSTSNASQLQLNTFKLYEPLTVAVIESRFANSIQLFDVSHNQLSTLSKDLFCPLSNEVRQLNISHNLLENFDCLGLISQAGQLCLSELRILDMSHNLVKHLPATGVATLQNLEILDLSHNLIESLDELSLSALYKLTKLDLSSNRIQQLPLRIFHKSNSMQVLKLQSNLLQTTINQTLLYGLISLEELNLSHNKITTVSDSAFIDKVNLKRVDLSHNQLSTLRHEALNVTSSIKQPAGFRPRLFHNGQYAGVAPKQSQSQSVSAEFLLASNPFICDCQLEWLRKPNSLSTTTNAAIKRNAASSTSTNTNSQMLDDQARQDQLSAQLMQMSSSNVYQNDQPPVILASSSVDSSNNISEIISNQQVDSNANRPQSAIYPANSKPMATLLTSGTSASASNSNSAAAQQAQVYHHYARVGDLDLIKCTPLFQRNTQRYHHNHHHHDRQQNSHRTSQLRPVLPSDGSNHNQPQHHHQSFNSTPSRQQDTMIDLLSADSSHFLCRYKSHCFALCHCCEFDACDCEMICPNGCNCYYDSTWQTNIIDCSSRNHTTVPDRIPMDVSGLYLDGNNIESLKPSNLIARKSLKALYLNSSNLQYIANRTFNGLIELQTLYLHDNQLRSLNGSEFEPLTQLRALYLQSNRLDHINNQTFIYLRSLEILDLSNNRLTHANLDLFWFIGHHNIRLRQLSIAHNWWSCQCSSINSFRSILKQKFLLNGSVNIADKNQLRCYYNSTTVGPLILADSSSISGTIPQQPLYASYPAASNRQTQLTEINQCSETIEDHQDVDVNPPLINPVLTDIPASTPPNEYPNDPIYNPELSHQPGLPKSYDNQPMIESPIYPPDYMRGVQPNSNAGGLPSGQRAFGSSSMPLTSFILLSLLLAVVMIIALSIFVFIRKQQRYHQSHKKSSAASTTSASSNASSTAISSLNGKSQRHQHLHHHTIQNPHLHHLIMSNGSGGATTTSIGHLQHQSHHHHSASSQSNIYAALVSPTTNNSTTVTNAINSNNGPGSIINSHLHNNPYSSSSTTASHHSGSSHGANNGFPQHWQSTAQHQASIYNQPYNSMSGMENHYTINASSASHKTASLYHPGTCAGTPTLGGQLTPNDWLKLPKVKQFMSKLVNKSLALGGYRSCSRDELSAITSDKIYDAFISYDKRDEAFVLQQLSAELEYGQPQYRIADRFRDLPLPTSNYIAEAITSVIGCSHRTIIVLTENYLASSWCRYELQAALREASMDKAHKIIAVVLDPKCLLEMDNEMRTLLTNSSVSIYQQSPKQQQSQPHLQQQQQQQQPQLVQLDGTSSSELMLQQQQQQQLVATLTNQSGGNQQVSTQTTQLATSKIAFINYNDRKFWHKIKQLMPLPRPSTQTLTLTTKN